MYEKPMVELCHSRLELEASIKRNVWTAERSNTRGSSTQLRHELHLSCLSITSRIVSLYDVMKLDVQVENTLDSNGTL